MKSRFALTLAAVAALALVAIIALSLGDGGEVQAGTGPAPDPFPAEIETFRTFAALGTDQEKADFLTLARYSERAAEGVSNVAVALIRNEVVGVDGVAYTGDQITAIQNAGLADLYHMKEGYIAALAVAGVTVAQVDAFAANNPALITPPPAVCTTDPAACPAE